LQEAQNNGLHILADVAGLRKGGGVGNGEGDIENSGKGPGQEGFAATGRTDEENVALFELHIGMVGGEGVGMLPANPLVMVVDGDRESALGPVLADHMTVEFGPDFPGFG
jgi:hypothetical protein